MKKLLVGSLLPLLFTASIAVAKEERPSVPVRGTEGPDIRMTHHASYPQAVPEIQGSAIR